MVSFALREFMNTHSPTFDIPYSATWKVLRQAAYNHFNKDPNVFDLHFHPENRGELLNDDCILIRRLMGEFWENKSYPPGMELFAHFTPKSPNDDASSRARTNGPVTGYRAGSFQVRDHISSPDGMAIANPLPEASAPANQTFSARNKTPARLRARQTSKANIQTRLAARASKAIASRRSRHLNSRSRSRLKSRGATPQAHSTEPMDSDGSYSIYEPPSDDTHGRAPMVSQEDKVFDVDWEGIGPAMNTKDSLQEASKKLDSGSEESLLAKARNTPAGLVSQDSLNTGKGEIPRLKGLVLHDILIGEVKESLYYEPPYSTRLNMVVLRHRSHRCWSIELKPFDINGAPLPSKDQRPHLQGSFSAVRFFGQFFDLNYSAWKKNTLEETEIIYNEIITRVMKVPHKFQLKNRNCGYDPWNMRHRSSANNNIAEVTDSEDSDYPLLRKIDPASLQKEKSRTREACVPCRTRRRKCGGLRPRCEPCLMSKEKCEYSETSTLSEADRSTEGSARWNEMQPLNTDTHIEDPTRRIRNVFNLLPVASNREHTDDQMIDESVPANDGKRDLQPSIQLNKEAAANQPGRRPLKRESYGLYEG